MYSISDRSSEEGEAAKLSVKTATINMMRL